MATEIQNQEQNRIQMLLDAMLTMDDSPGNWDLGTDEFDEFDEFDEDEPLPTEEEKEELWQDLVGIALLTHLKKHTFVRLTPKTNSKCSQPRSFIR